MKKQTLLLATALALPLTGCVSPATFQANKRAVYGTAGGSALGAVAGALIDGNHRGRGAAIGAALGALSGGLIGNYMDRQQAELQRQTAGSGITVKRLGQDTLKLNIPGKVLFALNQSAITPQFYPVLNKIAATLKRFPSTVVHVYGFTDKSGTPAYNLELSRKRAQATATYLADQGIAAQRFVIKGFGERFATQELDPQERRVDIILKAVNKNNPQAAYSIGEGPY